MNPVFGACRFRALEPRALEPRARACHIHPAVLLAAILLLPGALLSAQTVTSTKVGSRYMSEGRIHVVANYTRLESLISNYAGYAEWVLPGLDGSDAESAADWVIFTGIRFARPARFELDFDMNRPWPLDAKGNTAVFSVRSRRDGPALETVFEMQDPPFGVSAALLKVQAAPTSGVAFRLELEFWPLIDWFMDSKAFADFIERKVRRVTLNLENALRER